MRKGRTLVVHVQPRASTDEIVGMVDGRLKVRVKSPPVDGRSNQNVIELIASALGVPKTSIEMIRGRKSRYKTLLIDGLPGDPLELLGVERTPEG